MKNNTEQEEVKATKFQILIGEIKAKFPDFVVPSLKERLSREGIYYFVGWGADGETYDYPMVNSTYDYYFGSDDTKFATGNYFAKRSDAEKVLIAYGQIVR